MAEDTATARRLLAEAGYPDGKGFPKISILFNTLQTHKAVAEAAQEMWKKNLNIDVALRNEEWKRSISIPRNHMGITTSIRAGWVGDYPDPSTFMESVHHRTATTTRLGCDQQFV